MTTRTITVSTANFGRNVSIAEFKANVDRVFKNLPGQHRFVGCQEVDEADKPDEAAYIRKVFAKTHRFVGLKTAVPILVPKTFQVSRRVVTFASEGVAELSPHREMVQAVVHPLGKSDNKVVATNIHLGRNIPELKATRGKATAVIERRLDYWQDKDLPAWLTADLNAANYRKLGKGEERWVAAGLDVVRGYEAGGVKMQKLQTGTVDLTIDGHDCEWVKLKLTWP